MSVAEGSPERQQGQPAASASEASYSIRAGDCPRHCELNRKESISSPIGSRNVSQLDGTSTDKCIYHLHDWKRPRRSLIIAFHMHFPLPFTRFRLLFYTSRRGGRVAEGDGLLNRYTGSNSYPGFESRPLRFPSVIFCVIAIVLGGCTAMPAIPHSESAPDLTGPLIPRQILFGDLDHASVQLSHDGKYLSYLAPAEGVRNIWVAPLDNLSAAKVVSHETRRGISNYLWAWNDRDILFTQDHDGDENWNVFSIDVITGAITNLTPNPKMSAQILEVSDKHPDEIVVAINDRDPQFHDMHQVNLNTGQDRLLATNPGKIGSDLVDGFWIDGDLHVRMLQATTPEGGSDWYLPNQSG